WHYVRDDHMFSMIKLVSRHQNTQQFGALLPIELTNEDISSDTTVTPPTTAAGLRLSTLAKGKQPAKASKAKSLSTLSEMKELVLYQGFLMYSLMSLRKKSLGIPLMKKEGSDDGKASDEEAFIHPSLSTHAEEETRDEESFDPIQKTHENSDDEGNGVENLGTNVGREEGHDEEEEEDELFRDVNINLGRGIQTTQEFKDSHVTLTSVNPDGQQQSSSVSSQFVTMAPLPMSAPTLTSSTISTVTTTQQAPLPPTTASSTLLQDPPNFGSLFGFDNRLKTLEANFSEFMQTNQFAGSVSSIHGIVQRYLDQRMNEAVKVAVQIQSDRLRDEA
nr:hypothetical protein [Tanacetum cinerariifolium]